MSATPALSSVVVPTVVERALNSPVRYTPPSGAATMPSISSSLDGPESIPAHRVTSVVSGRPAADRSSTRLAVLGVVPPVGGALVPPPT